MVAPVHDDTTPISKGFDNRAFWDQRYRDNLALGSGIGSRGKNVHNKRTVIARFLDAVGPHSILDVGCGDHEVISGIETSAQYHGIDISPAIVEINRTRYPGKRFTCVDFSALDDVAEYASDAVISFEVLIHQHTREAYDNLLRNIVRATRHAGLISGYLTDPIPTTRSDIIAWHEPITTSLEKAGATNIEICGRSLNSEHIVFVAFRR